LVIVVSYWPAVLESQALQRFAHIFIS
jgi:hypothetical protein